MSFFSHLGNSFSFSRGFYNDPNSNRTPADPGAPAGGYRGTTGIGTLGYSNTQANYSSARLPRVANPDATMANVARGQHERYMRNYRDYENALIGATDDTSLIDAARADAPEQDKLTRGMAERNRQRYGLEQTAVEASESERASQRGAAINLAGGVNNARLAQRDVNQRLLGDLINIGQGVNRSSLSQLGAAAGNAVARKNAHTSAKAQSKSQTMGMLGAAGSLLAAFVI